VRGTDAPNHKSAGQLIWISGLSLPYPNVAEGKDSEWNKVDLANRNSSLIRDLIMEEKQGKRNLYVVATCLSLLLTGTAVGGLIWKYMNANPGYTITKNKISPTGLADFKKKLESMVLSYTVRSEGNIPIVHPPSNSDIYLLVSTHGWGEYILELEQGKSYRLNLASLDIKHTLAIRGLHLFNPIVPGELATIKFSPSKIGRFTLQCGYVCGPWHDTMNGIVIVATPPVIALTQ